MLAPETVTVVCRTSSESGSSGSAPVAVPDWALATAVGRRRSLRSDVPLRPYVPLRSLLAPGPARPGLALRPLRQRAAADAAAELPLALRRLLALERHLGGLLHRLADGVGGAGGGRCGQRQQREREDEGGDAETSVHATGIGTIADRLEPTFNPRLRVGFRLRESVFRRRASRGPARRPRPPPAPPAHPQPPRRDPSTRRRSHRSRAARRARAADDGPEFRRDHSHLPQGEAADQRRLRALTQVLLPDRLLPAAPGRSSTRTAGRPPSPSSATPPTTGS